MPPAETDSPPIRRRPVLPGDDPFILALYASTRAAELANVNWPPAQKEAFVRQQNEAQLHHYKTHFPHAVHEIILLADGDQETAVGRIYTDFGPDALRLLDITIAAPYRNLGIGGRLMQGLVDQAQAQAIPIRFHVFCHNEAAFRFYTRLGFQLLTDDGAYLEMGWDPSA